MNDIIELDLAADTIEATVNYLLDTGEMPWTYSGGPGSTEVRSGGAPDPRKVAIHDGRPHVGEFTLDRDGFRFVRHDTQHMLPCVACQHMLRRQTVVSYCEACRV